jgi:hypothetical protein
MGKLSPDKGKYPTRLQCPVLFIWSSVTIKVGFSPSLEDRSVACLYTNYELGQARITPYQAYLR